MTRSAIVASLVLCGLVGCSDASTPPYIADTEGGPVIERDHDAAPEVPCATPATGCPCTEAGAKFDCGRVYRISGAYVSCSEGFLTCEEDGGWSECVGDSIYDGGH
jgi:hypothetical protein